MNTLEIAEKLLETMSKAEKAQLLQWVVSDLGDFFPGIEKTPGTCGGAARVSGTRIPIWSLVDARNLGYSEDRLLQEYPALRINDLQNAWNYYRAHRKEIEDLILENEQD